MALPLAAAIALPVLGAAASYFGQKETNANNMAMNEQNNAANLEAARLNREWQERMSNTAHQREAEDYKAAGLNRILTATGGGGASTPSGSVATMNASRMENALGSSVSSALASANLAKDLDLAESQKALNASNISLQQNTQNLQTANASKLAQETLAKARENNIAEPALADMRDAAKEQAAADLKTAKVNNKMATFDAFQTRTKNVFDTAGSAKDVINPFKGLLGPGGNIPTTKNFGPTNRLPNGFKHPNGTKYEFKK